eukprot:3099989-Prymnesium_polylepis.1
MKPTGVATLIPASALESRTKALGIIYVYRGRECIGLGEVPDFVFVPPFWGTFPAREGSISTARFPLGDP